MSIVSRHVRYHKVVAERGCCVVKVGLKTKDSAESLVGAYCAESTFDNTAGSGITTNFPPLFDGPTSWVKYEELIDDWLDVTVLEETKKRTSTEEWTCRRRRNVHRSS